MQIADGTSLVLGLVRAEQPIVEHELNEGSFRSEIDLLNKADAPQETPEFNLVDHTEQPVGVVVFEQETGLDSVGAVLSPNLASPVIEGESVGDVTPQIAPDRAIGGIETPEQLPLNIDLMPAKPTFKSGFFPPDARAQTVSDKIASVSTDAVLETQRAPVATENSVDRRGPSDDFTAASQNFADIRYVHDVVRQGETKTSTQPTKTSQSQENFIQKSKHIVAKAEQLDYPRSIAANQLTLQGIETVREEPQTHLDLDGFSIGYDKIKNNNTAVLSHGLQREDQNKFHVNMALSENSHSTLGNKGKIQTDLGDVTQDEIRLPIQHIAPSASTGPNHMTVLPVQEVTVKNRPTTLKDSIGSSTLVNSDNTKKVALPSPSVGCHPNGELLQINGVIRSVNQIGPDLVGHRKAARSPGQVESLTKNMNYIKLLSDSEMSLVNSFQSASSDFEIIEKTNQSQQTNIRTAETVRDIAHQIKEATQSKERSYIEIRLSPEELGKVRISLSPQEAGGAVSIIVERPETFDLMRRHVDQLLRELKSAGWSDFDLSLSHQDSGNTGNSEKTEDVKLRDASMQNQDSDRENAAELPMQTPLSLTRPIRTDRLDLRI